MLCVRWRRERDQVRLTETLGSYTQNHPLRQVLSSACGFPPHPGIVARSHLIASRVFVPPAGARVSFAASLAGVA